MKQIRSFITFGKFSITFCLESNLSINSCFSAVGSSFIFFKVLFKKSFIKCGSTLNIMNMNLDVVLIIIKYKCINHLVTMFLKCNTHNNSCNIIRRDESQFSLIVDNLPPISLLSVSMMK